MQFDPTTELDGDDDGEAMPSTPSYKKPRTLKRSTTATSTISSTQLRLSSIDPADMTSDTHDTEDSANRREQTSPTKGTPSRVGGRFTRPSKKALGTA